MALVADCGGVRYIDDSKATNPASAIADLLSIEGPAIVIAGGKEKDTDFAEYGAVLAQKAKHVFVMGECAQRIMDAVGDPSRCTLVTSMDEAVARAIAVAEAGDTVTLCPACSSLDMFASYAARGDAFARAVRERVG
jgi:UDP-N-acetylmuramoylalanine--D-glutamate ligase